MGEENLDDKLANLDYWLALYALGCLEKDLLEIEQYELLKFVRGAYRRISDDYINFRLDKYDSEGRKVISEVYKVLGYNPTKLLGDGKNEKL